MSDADIANVKDAIVDPSTAKDSVLEFYDPTEVRIGLVALPYKQASNPCLVERHQSYPAPVPPNQSLWQIAGFSNDYRTAAEHINPGSILVQMVQCLAHADGNVLSFVPGGPRNGSGNHTNHAEPLQAAQALLNQGRPGGTRRHHLLRRRPVEPAVAVQPAVSVRVRRRRPTPRRAGRPSSRWATAWTPRRARRTPVGAASSTTGCGTYFLSRVASPYPSGVLSDDNAPGGCAADENTDGDYYFCESRGEDLETVFHQIAVQSIQRSRLLNF